MCSTIRLAKDNVFRPGANAFASLHQEGAIGWEVDTRFVQADRSRRLRVGFIGLDHVGRKMALRLLGAGHRLTVYDANPGKADALTSAGATVADCIRDACREVDVVFTLLADDATVEAVVLGADGVVESMTNNAIHIGSSCVSLDCADHLVVAHWDASRRYISAPLLGGPELTADGELFFVAGGWNEEIAEVRSLLDAVGQVTAELDGWPSRANTVQLTRILRTREFT